MGRKNYGPLVWFEEYRSCGCSFIADKKAELPGYCPTHGNDSRGPRRVPDNDHERGLVG